MSDSEKFKQSSYLYGANASFIEELYEKYLENPNLVEKNWQDYFANLAETKHDAINWFLASKKERKASKQNYSVNETSGQSINKFLASKSDAELMLNKFRKYGHYLAKLDPLEIEQQANAADYHLEFADFAFLPGVKLDIFGQVINADEAYKKLLSIYSGTIAFEFEHVENLQEKNWLYQQVEKEKAELPSKKKIDSLKLLAQTEGLEQFLQLRFPGVKRFSVEGADSSIVAMNEIIESASEAGAADVIIGMAHRGRLNVLAQIMEKPYESLLSEFAGAYAHPENLEISGDVKYHLGCSVDKNYSGKKIHVSLTPNPSHLEAVNPVVAGRVRAKQDLHGSKDSTLGVLVHGDAAFCGQGIVAESLMLSVVDGYDVGGVVHIIINNQVGFTATAKNGRRSRYSSDFAKIIAAPIIHVNGNDVEQVIRACSLAVNYRTNFKKDVVIELICYRKHGHNEIDEPRFTQPIMYKKVDAMQTTGEVFANTLEQNGEITKSFFEEYKASYKEKLDKALEGSKIFKVKEADWFKGNWNGYSFFDLKDNETKVDELIIKNIGKTLYTTPENFQVHPTIARGLAQKKQMIETGKSIDWALAEALAYGTLLHEGFNVRITGQDSERGTFSHRHAVLHNQLDGGKYIPLSNISRSKAKFEVVSSLLSEYGVMGFEYGYSTTNPKTLVIWEAQFGDFANGAQIIIDQFISSAETKWLRQSGLVLLLPHGYEGQGPEHSSARLERFLQLCAEDNIQVVNCTTPASFFHVLRRQMHRNYRKPLVVMSPKSLLRHKGVISDLQEFTDRNFEPILDFDCSKEKINKIILCSGKIYYDLLDKVNLHRIEQIALIRLEQLYPFPANQLRQLLSHYPGATQIIWCQEEPKNQGAWNFIHSCFAENFTDLQIKYCGGKALASASAGYSKMHNQQHESIIKSALGYN